MEPWIQAALSYDVEGDPAFYESLAVTLLPGGVVLVDADWQYFVLRAEYKRRPRRYRQKPGIHPSPGMAFLTKITLETKEGLDIDRGDALDLWPYVNAIHCYIATAADLGSWRQLPRHLAPQDGKPTDSRFYLELLSLYDSLIAKGSTRPAAEIAERYGKNRATVRSWLLRARDLRDEGKS